MSGPFASKPAPTVTELKHNDVNDSKPCGSGLARDSGLQAYEYRNAVAGSTFAARHAGYTVAKKSS